MANYLSQPTKYGEPKSQFNAELASKVLQAKQGQYDINKARVDAVLGEYQNLEFINAEAKEDFYNNIQGVLNEVNSSNLRDLGDTSVADKILGSINKALTPETLKHNQVAKAYYASEKKWEKMFEKDQKLYSDGNKRYVDRVSGINDYMQNGDYSKVNLGMLTNPIAYTDYDANGRKAISEIQSARGNEVQEWYDADGIQHKLDTSSLSISDIFMVRENIFNDKDRMQMRIDASNEFHNMTPEQVKEATLNMNQMKIGQVELDLRKLGSMESSGYITDDQKKAIADKKQALEIYKEQLGNFNYDTVSNDENSLQYIKENTVLAALADSIGVGPSRKTSMPAHVYNNIQKGKETKEALSRIKPFTLPTGPEDEKNLFSNTYNRLATLNNTVSEEERGIFNNITQGLTTEEVESNMNTIRDREDFKLRFPDATEDDLKIAYIDEYGKSSKNKYGSKTVEEAYQDLVNTRVRRDQLSGVVAEAERIGRKVQDVENTSELYNEFSKGANIAYVNSEGAVVNVRDTLRLAGVDSEQSFADFMDSPEYDEIRRSMEMGKFLSTRASSTTGKYKIGNILYEEGLDMTAITPDVIESFNRLLSGYEQGMDFYDVMDIEAVTDKSILGIATYRGGQRQLTQQEEARLRETGTIREGNQNTRFNVKVKPWFTNTDLYNKLVKEAELAVMADTGGSSTISIQDGVDRNTRTMATTPKLNRIADKEINEEAFNRVINDKSMGKVNVGFSIPNLKEFDDLYAQAGSLTQPDVAIIIDGRNLEKGEVSAPYTLSNKKHASFRFNRLTRDLITISQVDGQGVTQSVDVSIGNVRELAPDIYKKIMEYGTEEIVEYRVNTSQRSDNINYISNKDVLRQRLNHFGSPELNNMANKQNAKNLLKNTLESNIGQDSQGVYSDVTAALDNSNSFSVEIENVQDTNYPYYKYNMYHGDELIGSQVREGGQPSEREWGILELMPSAIMTTILNSAIIDFNETGDINNSETLVNLRRALQKIQQKKQANQ